MATLLHTKPKNQTPQYYYKKQSTIVDCEIMKIPLVAKLPSKNFFYLKPLVIQVSTCQ